MKFKKMLDEKDKLIEDLAELEHIQWMEWAKSILKSENISDERSKRWETLFVEYSELSEKSKDQDRVYAKKIIEILEKYQ